MDNIPPLKVRTRLFGLSISVGHLATELEERGCLIRCRCVACSSHAAISDFGYGIVAKSVVPELVLEPGWDVPTTPVRNVDDVVSSPITNSFQVSSCNY